MKQAQQRKGRPDTLEPRYFLTKREVNPLVFTILVGGYAFYYLWSSGGSLAGLFSFPFILLAYIGLAVTLGRVVSEAFSKPKTFKNNSLLRILLLVILPFPVVWLIAIYLFG